MMTPERMKVGLGAARLLAANCCEIEPLSQKLANSETAGIAQ
ncbi:hypothetical protein OHU11_00925 [Streptomyces sp. NBC_00257]|nr:MULTISPECIES: hypothetical protein [unclassified Streptomyces]MCX4869926.1 hypothetical protein [Streptomyces sp. NBC_00906]MCX4901089.1 hypothetical protein [Streptomyces sp. NBC_00892]WTH87736.1 hypothetical protein OIC43_00705 [Streptomyces sp. NBC_00825]